MGENSPNLFTLAETSIEMTSLTVFLSAPLSLTISSLRVIVSSARAVARDLIQKLVVTSIP